MNKDENKVIMVTEETKKKISKKMMVYLAAMGVELVVRDEAPTLVDVEKEINLIQRVEVQEVDDFIEKDRLKQVENSKLVQKYAPRKIGNTSKAKCRQAKGKRHGR